MNLGHSFNGYGFNGDASGFGGSGGWDFGGSKKFETAANTATQSVGAAIPKKLKTMGDVKEFLDLYVKKQNESSTHIGMKEMCTYLNVEKTRGQTLNNYLKFAKCLERVNGDRITAAGGKMDNVTLLGFSEENKTMRIAQYVAKIKKAGTDEAAYTNWTALIRDTKNNLGDEYTPDMSMLDLD